MKKLLIKILALSISVVIMCTALTACALFPTNADPDKTADILKEAGYDVETVDNSLGMMSFALFGFETDDLDCVISASNDDKDAIIIFYYDDEEAANDAFKKAEDAVDNLNELEEEYGEKDEDTPEFVLEQSGNIIFYGSKNAIRAAKLFIIYI